MKRQLFLPIAVAMLTVCACGNKTTAPAQDADTAAVEVDSSSNTTDTLQAQTEPAAETAEDAKKAEEEAVTVYLHSLYNYVLKDKGDADDLAAHFSPAVKKRLKDANEYEDGSLAFWELRTGNQDGPSNVSRVNDITHEGDWYVVKYTDMGTPGSTKFKVEVKDGFVTVTDYQRK